LLLGYLEFVALLFVPGLALMEVFRLGGEFSFTERLALAFGLGMAIDVLTLAFRTSGVLIGSQLMIGIFPGTLGLLLGVSLAAFAVPVVLRRRVDFYVKPSRTDLYVLGLVLAQALLVVAHFSKYPIFPQFSSVDFGSHVQITADLQAGRATMFPGGILYYGAHLLMGSLVALSGDLALEATQYAMGILAALSPLLVFVAVDSLTRSKRVGLIATLLYVSTGFVWFGSVFDAGLYANFYGILSILLLFALIPAVLKQPRRPGVWVALVLAVGSGYFSHYSFVTVIPAIVALPFAIYLAEGKVSLPSLAVPAVVVVPALLAFALRPDLVSLLIQFVQAQGGGNVKGDTSVSGYLAGWPVLRYIVVEIADDVGAVVTLLLAALGVYLGVRGKNPAVWVLVVWLLAILAVAPFTETAWRFSYMALLPLVIVAALGFDWLIPQPPDRALRQRSKMRAKADYTRYRQGLLVVTFLLLFVGSWSWQLLGDSASNGSANNQTQHAVLAAMKWMNATAPPGSQVVSVTDSDYNYYQLIYGRASGYAPLATPDSVVQASAGSAVPTYVVMTAVGTVAVPDPSQNPFHLYPKDSRFKLQYNQSGVLVYELPPEKQP
jgi:hypothetical protein